MMARVASTGSAKGIRMRPVAELGRAVQPRRVQQIARDRAEEPSHDENLEWQREDDVRRDQRPDLVVQSDVLQENKSGSNVTWTGIAMPKRKKMKICMLNRNWILASG